VAAALLQFPSLTYTGIGAAGLAMLLLTISHFRKRGHARGQSNELADLAQQMGWSLSEEDEYLLGNLWGFELSSDQPPSFVLSREGRFGREIADVLDPGPGRLSSGQEYEVRMFRFCRTNRIIQDSLDVRDRIFSLKAEGCLRKR
jgi:hypothetical protein